MGFREFLIELAQHGQVKIADPRTPDAAEVAECVDLFEQQARRCAMELAGTAPAPVIEPMRWAAVMLYRACQFLVWREFDAEQVRTGLLAPCPMPADPAVCYAVDFYMRYLPDLIALSRGIAEDDPLVEGLMRLAVEWPMSSVGVRGVSGVDATPFISHPGLRQLYIDRIIERGDASRLDDAKVREALEETVGLYPMLAGRVGAKLKQTGAEEFIPDDAGENRD